MYKNVKKKKKKPRGWSPTMTIIIIQTPVSRSTRYSHYYHTDAHDGRRRTSCLMFTIISSYLSFFFCFLLYTAVIFPPKLICRFIVFWASCCGETVYYYTHDLFVNHFNNNDQGPGLVALQNI